MFSFVGFANKDVEKILSNEWVLVSISTEKNELDCANKGGVCLLSFVTNGNRQTREVCCDTIIVVKVPKTVSVVE